MWEGSLQAGATIVDDDGVLLGCEWHGHAARVMPTVSSVLGIDMLLVA